MTDQISVNPPFGDDPDDSSDTVLLESNLSEADLDEVDPFHLTYTGLGVEQIQEEALEG